MNSKFVVKSERCFEWSFELLSKTKAQRSPEFLFANRKWCFYFLWSSGHSHGRMHDNLGPGGCTGTQDLQGDNFSTGIKPRLSMVSLHPHCSVLPKCSSCQYMNFNVWTEVEATLNINRRKRVSRSPYTILGPTIKTSTIRDENFSLNPFNLTHRMSFSENQNNITSIKISFCFSDKAILSEVSPENGGLPKINDPCNSSLLEDMTSLLSDSSMSDLELKCKDGSVKAHKLILCARSQVFAAMFQSGMEESRSGEVNIHDMDTEDMKTFLQYLYTGTLPDLSLDTALQLYEASDKYAVLGLKKRCIKFLTENFLAGNFSEENACDLLVVADAHSDKDLKKEVISFILDKKIPLKENIWMDFLKRQPVLAGEVLTQYYYQHNQ